MHLLFPSQATSHPAPTTAQPTKTPPRQRLNHVLQRHAPVSTSHANPTSSLTAPSSSSSSSSPATKTVRSTQNPPQPRSSSLEPRSLPRPDVPPQREPPYGRLLRRRGEKPHLPDHQHLTSLSLRIQLLARLVGRRLGVSRLLRPLVTNLVV